MPRITRVAIGALIALSLLAPQAVARDAKKDAFTLKLEQYREQAAEGWLALVDEALKRSVRQPDSDETEAGPAARFRKALAALPPPAAWEALSKAIDARPVPQGRAGIAPLGLRLIGHVLSGDEQAQQADVAALDALTKSSGTFAERAAAEYVADLLPPDGDNAAASAAQFERSVERASREDNYLYAPDLVSLVGRERAEPILRKALGAPVTLNVYAGEQSKRLARELALKHVNELKVAQWQLIELEDVALFEAMEKRFPRPTTRQSGGLFAGLFGAGGDGGEMAPEWGRDQAERVYLLGLMAAGRTDDARRVIARMRQRHADDDSEDINLLPYDALVKLAEADRERVVYEALHVILRQTPELPLWYEYRMLAARAGRIEQMIEAADAALRGDVLPPKQRNAIRLQLHQALLAVDRIDDAVVVLRELIDAEPDAEEKDRDDPVAGSTKLQRGTELLELGLLLERPEWRDQGVRTVEAEIARRPAEGELGIYAVREAAAALVDAGRGAQVANLLTGLMVSEQESAEEAPDEASEYDYDEDDEENDGVTATLAHLLSVYHRAGRPEDVVALLDTTPYWGVSDLSEIYLSTGLGETPVGYVAADALLKTGQRDAALKIIDALLASDVGFDGAYALRVQAGTDDEAIARFDELFARDRFEERPLIWKAHVLHRTAKLDEAERLARQAIEIDPFDGNHDSCHATIGGQDDHSAADGAADRTRAYAVLGDILQARGDAKGAESARRVVEAMRALRRGDALYEAGLLTRAIATYENAVTHAPQVQPLRLRLAQRLEELGRHEQAAEHYREAYRLMPGSTGRVDGSCFNCASAFPGPRARTIADEVLTKLLDDRPKSPQAHYLLGRLREEQGRDAAALELYRRAVELDPDHVGAWQQIEGLAWSTRMPARDSDKAILNVIRLDPLQRHTSPDFTEVRDLRALWSAIQDMLRVKSEQPKSLYPLAASAAELAKSKAAKQDEPEEAQPEAPFEPYGYDYADPYERPTSPGQAISRSSVISAIADLIAEEE
ncbi:MAG TPA: tetratricopeptide repeat protein [Tepidisphaeraceae bacterium]|nr:tetratricopeptide repeat protein [Tepidisphaeraceae bacterium]